MVSREVVIRRADRHCPCVGCGMSGLGAETGRLLCIPVGLVLTFFGYAVLRPGIVVVLAGECGSLAMAEAGAAGAAVGAAAAAALAMRMVYYGSPAAMGLALGAAVGLSLGTGSVSPSPVPLPAALLLARVLGVGAAFALIFAVVPEEVGIYVTAYGGSYLVWHGLSFVDSEIFASDNVLPGLVEMRSVDMWFNILSFLLVGLIGVCTQIILIRNQRYAAVDVAYEYTEIP